MKTRLSFLIAVLLLLFSVSSHGWWGNNNWGGWNSYPVWTPMYWAEEMTGNNNYYGPYGYPNNGYGGYPNYGYGNYPGYGNGGYPNYGYGNYPGFGNGGYPNYGYGNYPGYGGGGGGPGWGW